MKRIAWLVPTLLAFVVGCGGSSQVAESPSTPSSTDPAVARESQGDAKTPTDGDGYQQQPIVNAPAAVLPVKPNSPPEEVVSEFLKAMKTGDDGVAAGLLTKTAREETAKHNLAVQPPGSPTAEYEVAAGEPSEEDPAVSQVECVWSEREADGTERSEHVWWVLRKHREGWRVFGMATEMPTRTEPVFFNFEEPEEMTALMETISQEMASNQSDDAEPVAEEEGTVRGAERTKGRENSLR
jgi:hypothetical protein